MHFDLVIIDGGKGGGEITPSYFFWIENCYLLTQNLVCKLRNFQKSKKSFEYGVTFFN